MLALMSHPAVKLNYLISMVFLVHQVHHIFCCLHYMKQEHFGVREFQHPSTYDNSMVVNSDHLILRLTEIIRNSNYRCFVIYDSLTTQFHKRSDPASYATIWQDMVEISNCKDPDIAYGLNGSLYHVYIGNLSGNLYINKNYNSGDPSSFFDQHTVETGATDTTFAPEIIASRARLPAIKP
ncbi:MAG: hypothetical protein MZV64_30310 [Ignavibacteriales bacterium]|nr:hypothetical protein [Ignavibacteriales bacterium]